LLRRSCPAQHAHKLALFGDAHAQFAGQEVPDPYYGGVSGFERVLDIVEEVSASLLDSLQQEIASGRAGGSTPGRARR